LLAPSTSCPEHQLQISARDKTSVPAEAGKPRRPVARCRHAPRPAQRRGDGPRGSQKIWRLQVRCPAPPASDLCSLLLPPCPFLWAQGGDFLLHSPFPLEVTICSGIAVPDCIRFAPWKGTARWALPASPPGKTSSQEPLNSIPKWERRQGCLQLGMNLVLFNSVLLGSRCTW
jgi:hypothetical protein